MIREISIESVFTNDAVLKEKYRAFNISGYCASEHFVRLLGKFNVGKMQKLVIECDENAITKMANYDDGSIQVLRRQIDMDNYLQLSDLDKKNWAVEIIVSAFEELHQHFDFSLDEITNTAKQMASENYINHFAIGKPVANKSRTYKANLFGEFDIDEFRLYLEIYDKSANRLKRILVKKTPNFAFKVMFSTVKWMDDNNVCVLNNDKKAIKKVTV